MADSKSQRPMAPREHGAWGNLGFPLMTGLIAVTPTLPGALWAAASIALFLAHEPLLVLLGQRGARIQRRDGGHAKRNFGLRLAVGLVLGAGFVAVASPDARLWALAPVAGAVALLPFTLKGKEKTAPGEIVAGFAFAGNVLPILAAADRVDLGLIAASVWFVGFTEATIAVRAVIHQPRSERVVVGRIVAPIIALASLAGAAVALSQGLLHPLVLAAVACPALVTLALCVRPPAPKYLRKVGLGLGICFGLCFLLLLTGLLLVA